MYPGDVLQGANVGIKLNVSSSKLIPASEWFGVGFLVFSCVISVFFSVEAAAEIINECFDSIWGPNSGGLSCPTVFHKL